MALTGIPISKETDMQQMTKPGRRLWLTADRDRVVEDGDPAAAVLWCTEHDEVPAADAERLGAVKARKAGADKSRKDGEDKAEGDGE